MPGYLEGYGEGEERRSKMIRWTLAGVFGALIIGGLLYFFLRDIAEDRTARAFIAALQRKDYAGAYRMWGCTEANPCRDYRFERFLEDWGPQSPAADPSKIRLEHPQLSPGVIGWIRNVLRIQYSCPDGVIYHVHLGKGEPVLLYVFRKDKTIGFAPWPVCAPRFRM